MCLLKSKIYQIKGTKIMEMLYFMAPIATVLILLEMYAAKQKNLKVYSSWKATLSSLANGTVTIFTGVFLNIFVFYSLAVEHIGLISYDPSHWSTWVIAIFAMDFTFYVGHRACHEIPLLWAMHCVHHQSHDYNLSVGVRTPWLQPLMFSPFIFLLALSGIPVAVLGPVYLGQQVYKLLVHTQLIGNLGILEKLFVTPKHHGTHHAYNEQYRGKNYGGVFLIWDKLFKSYVETKEKPVYGVSSEEVHNPLRNNIDPWIELFSKKSSKA